MAQATAFPNSGIIDLSLERYNNTIHDSENPTGMNLYDLSMSYLPTIDDAKVQRDLNFIPYTSMSSDEFIASLHNAAPAPIRSGFQKVTDALGLTDPTSQYTFTGTDSVGTPQYTQTIVPDSGAGLLTGGLSLGMILIGAVGFVLLEKI